MLVGAGVVAASIGAVVSLGPAPSVGAAPPPAGAIVVGVAGPDCPSPSSLTIQAAVDVAAAGSTIYVCAGFYNEHVTINKPLTLLGAQFGQDARTGRTDAAAETIVDAALGPFVYAEGASTGTVDGFTLRNSDVGAILGVNNAARAYTFQNNIITGNAVGMNIHTVGPDVTLIRQNRFVANIKVRDPAPNPNSGTGVFVTSGHVVGMTVEDNLFQGNVGPNAADVNTPGDGTPSSGITVRNNVSIDDATFIVMDNTTGTEVSDNAITHTDPAGSSGSAILLWAANPGAVITGNTIDGGLGLGIGDLDFTVPTGNPTITDNTISNRTDGVRLSQPGATISGNTITNSSHVGLWMQAGATGGNVTGNSVAATAGVDCQDDSTGDGTSGTANDWTANTGVTSSPAGLCSPPPPDTTTTTTTTAATTTTTTVGTTTTTTAATPVPPTTPTVPPPTTPLPPDPGQLPATGSGNTLRLVPVALLLIAGGLVLSRRRRPSHDGADRES